MSSCRVCGAFLWTKENKGDTTRRILNRLQIVFAPCSTHNIISSMPNREVADVDDGDNSGQAIDTVAERQIFGTHDSLIEYTTCTLAWRTVCFSLAEIRWNYKGLRTHRHDDGWLNFRPHEWTDSSVTARTATIELYYGCFSFHSIETKSNNWLIRTSEKWIFLAFDIDSMILFPLFISRKWELMEFGIFNLHPQIDCKWLTRKVKRRTKLKSDKVCQIQPQKLENPKVLNRKNAWSFYEGRLRGSTPTISTSIGFIDKETRPAEMCECDCYQ